MGSRGQIEHNLLVRIIFKKIMYKSD